MPTGFEPLLDIIHSRATQAWHDRNQRAFDALFGAPFGRYPKAARASVTLRAPEIPPDSGVPFAAYIHIPPTRTPAPTAACPS